MQGCMEAAGGRCLAEFCATAMAIITQDGKSARVTAAMLACLCAGLDVAVWGSSTILAGDSSRAWRGHVCLHSWKAAGVLLHTSSPNQQLPQGCAKHGGAGPRFVDALAEKIFNTIDNETRVPDALDLRTR
jgi:hypothetical protein